VTEKHDMSCKHDSQHNRFQTDNFNNNHMKHKASIQKHGNFQAMTDVTVHSIGL